jgi:hypothetical protein
MHANFVCVSIEKKIKAVFVVNLQIDLNNNRKKKYCYESIKTKIAFLYLVNKLSRKIRSYT